MENYLIAIGMWNLVGSFMMIVFFYEPFGKKILNEWTKIFTIEFKLDYWSKFWLGWAIGLNIFLEQSTLWQHHPPSLKCK